MRLGKGGYIFGLDTNAAFSTTMLLAQLVLAIGQRII